MPGTLRERRRRTARASSASTSRSAPKIFSTTWPRTPLTASSTLSLIGCGEVVADAGDLGQRRAHRLDERVLRRRPAATRRAASTCTKVSLMLTPSSSVPSSGRPCSLRRLDAPRGTRAAAAARRVRTSPPALERDARRHLDEDHDVAFVELGQELAAEPRRDESRHERDERSDAEPARARRRREQRTPARRA